MLPTHAELKDDFILVLMGQLNRKSELLHRFVWLGTKRLLIRRMSCSGLVETIEKAENNWSLLISWGLSGT